MSTSDSLAPSYLIASPRLDGGPFERALILMVHHDEHGSMGFIVNKPLDQNLGMLLSHVEGDLSDFIGPEEYESPVHFGGPVSLEQLWMIGEVGEENYASYGALRDPDVLEREGVLRFHEDWLLAASWEIISSYTRGDRRVHHAFLGYTGWGAGQLASEIEEGSWLVLDFDEGFLTEPIPRGEIWRDALDQLGVPPAAFLMMSKSGMA